MAGGHIEINIVASRFISERNQIARAHERILDASNRDFNFSCLNSPLIRSKCIFFQHEPICVPNVLFQLFDGRSLTEYARDLRQPSNKPVAVPPVLEL